jgi:hypothetical protein
VNTTDTVLNEDIMRVISTLVWEAIEDNPRYRESMDPFNAALSRLSKAGLITEMHALENTPFVVADVVGRMMFELGLKIGRDPMTVLTLPPVVGSMLGS